ncbi:MAG: dihydrolipoamide acetyltransferase family protein [Saprospiraceae bacterium]
MASIELKMPKMGESIMEATILKWLKKEGESVALEEPILEIATDKVDSEVPSPVEGVIEKIFFREDETVEVGAVLAIINEEVGQQHSKANGDHKIKMEQDIDSMPLVSVLDHSSEVTPKKEELPDANLEEKIEKKERRFYSPLVKNIAKKEQIPVSELDLIEGTGKGGRLTKDDLLKYLNKRTGKNIKKPSQPAVSKEPVPRSIDGEHEIIEMDRMRRLIADHMVQSKKSSPHVTSFVEVDVTNIVNWRTKVKDDFFEKFGEKITFTPIFIEAVVSAIRAFPMINISLEGTTIIKKHRINIGMATALPGGNLIVPVIKNADHFSLLGLTKQVNLLADKARTNRLKPEDIQEGTFTVTNVGTFGNVMGTPIINQPQVAILAVGAIRKKPAVVETEFGDLIAVRHMMFLSLSYDHRIVDGFLGGSFLRKVGDLLEQFDVNRAL